MWWQFVDDSALEELEPSLASISLLCGGYVSTDPGGGVPVRSGVDLFVGLALRGFLAATGQAVDIGFQVNGADQCALASFADGQATCIDFFI